MKGGCRHAAVAERRKRTAMIGGYGLVIHVPRALVVRGFLNGAGPFPHSMQLDRKMAVRGALQVCLTSAQPDVCYGLRQISNE